MKNDRLFALGIGDERLHTWINPEITSLGLARRFGIEISQCHFKLYCNLFQTLAAPLPRLIPLGVATSTARSGFVRHGFVGMILAGSHILASTRVGELAEAVN